MIDYEILKEVGTTNERLREFFTAREPSVEQAAKMDPARLKNIRDDIKKRKEFETWIGGMLQEHVIYSLANHRHYSAVDLAWDSVPINRYIYPLMMYAQGRIDVGGAEKALKDLTNGEQYVRRNVHGAAVGIDLPKFTEMNINLLRSVITRRVAAQDVKYANIWPFFNYESRSLTQVGRLRGDLTSQRMDIMADQYGYRHFLTQCTRDMFLYTNSVAFPRASWEREVQWYRRSEDPAITASGKLAKDSRVVKEGISWVNPHPSRVFWDNAYPVSSLNTDSGCEYVGFWDVCRWKDIAANLNFFNRDAVSFSADTAAWFSRYSVYFNQYYDKITPPTLPEVPGEMNDRKNNVGLYTGEMSESATFFSHLWVKVKPRQWRWGEYPFPVWVHLKVAGDSTVVYADIMPSSPCAVFSYNCNDGRLLSISVAHELMQLQDIMTNLFSQLLESAKADMFAVAILNTDIFPDTENGRKIMAEFKAALTGKNFYASLQVLDASFEKLSQMLGREVTPDMVFKVVRMPPNTNITALFQSIAQVISMAERLMVMSQHEQGQAASHEMTASESNQIATSTDTIYDFISNALDEGRAAMKRICYESTIACGEPVVRLPVANRYPDSVIADAGFEVEEQDNAELPLGYKTVMGDKTGLVHDYIFTSRDGGERANNAQNATVIVQLLQAIGSFHPAAQNAILSAMGKTKLLETVNSVFRLADVGTDLKLELKPGDSDELLVEDDQQVMAVIQQLAEAVKRNTDDVNAIRTALMGQAAPTPTA